MKIYILFDYYFINGSLIDCLEYFLFLYKYLKKDVYFVFIDKFISKKDIENIINSRYINIDIDDIFKNIIQIKKINLLKEKNKLIVFDYTTLSKIYNFLGNNKLLICSNIDKDFINIYPKYKNYLILGEMPFHYYNEYYEYKFLFDNFKVFNDIKDYTLVRSMTDCDLNTEDYSIYNLEYKKTIVYDNNIFYKNGIYGEFNKYIYIAGKLFDQKPRMLIECEYYNKDIQYFNNIKMQDGAYYRYNWILNNDIILRNFNEDDRVLKWCLSPR